jgi:putative transposase
MTAVVQERPEGLPLAMACRALGLNRSSVYARQQASCLAEAERAERRSRRACVQPRALTPEERQAARAALYSPEYRDQPPAEVHAALLAQGQYLGSLSTFHRILRADAAQGERRLQRPPQQHAIPRLCATAPHQVWTWDISKLATLRRGVYLSLYVVLDLYSRYVLAWMVSRKENSVLAQQLMQEAIARYGVAFAQLTVHQDRGAPMTARSYLDLLAEFGVTCSHSRPRVSNDNPKSEAQFKTLKYQPDYPGRFESAEHARRWCEDYFTWYNHQHHHSGLGFYTPTQVFTGQYRAIARVRQAALDAHYHQHPERFVHGPPKAALPPAQVLINPVEAEDADRPEVHLVNFPTLPAAREALQRYL